jgi:MOSC domain-containing protein YiiM
MGGVLTLRRVSKNHTGRVASLHLHPDKGGDPMRAVQEFEAVERRGIRGNPRKFGVMSRTTGKQSKRQVSLIEREQIAEHAATLGLQTISPGAVRANIETDGINLVALVGHEVQIGEAILYLYEARIPCEKMDRICEGLRALMEDGKQGVLAQVVRSGVIRVGDAVESV